MATFVKKHVIPESVVEEGTAKRNILRKGGPTRTRKDTAAGKLIDDGYSINVYCWSIAFNAEYCLV